MEEKKKQLPRLVYVSENFPFRTADCMNAAENTHGRAENQVNCFESRSTWCDFLFIVIALLTTLYGAKLWVSNGNPCRNEPEESCRTTNFRFNTFRPGTVRTVEF